MPYATEAERKAAAKAAKARYRASDKGKATEARYAATPKARASAKAANAKHYPKGMIQKWKKADINPGVWTWEELYEIWADTVTCWECDVTLTNDRKTTGRCLDHVHDITGCFRGIVCRGCNNSSNHADVPNLAARTATLTSSGRAMRRKNGTRDAPPLINVSPGTHPPKGTPEWKAYANKRARDWTAKPGNAEKRRESVRRCRVKKKANAAIQLQNSL